MNTQEIYKVASELTEKAIVNILGAWNNENDTNSINEFNTLVRLGDSKALAIATVIANKFNKKEESKMYYSAYNL